MGGLASIGGAIGSFFGPVGAIAGSLIGGMLDGGGDDEGGGAAPPPPATVAPPVATQMPGTLLSGPAADATGIGAGLEEATPAEAKKVSVAAQTRRRGRRSTILTPEGGGDETEYLGGI